MTISISYPISNGDHHISLRVDWGMIWKLLYYNLFIIYLTVNKQNLLFLKLFIECRI